MARVVLVRPWTDAHAGGSGCCGGEARHGICLERQADHDAGATRVGMAFQALRAELPEVDVQIVAASNTAYLLPSTYRATRSRFGRMEALRHAARATAAGAVLVDGIRVGDVDELGADGVVREVRRRLVTA